MTILERLAAWREGGAISEAQYDTIAAIVRKDKFSVFFELNVLLYLGVLSLIGGIAWTIQTYVTALGSTAILGGLTLLLSACFAYCFSKGLPFSAGPIASPTFAFDYVLYLGCLTFATEVSYIESQFHLLQNHWDYYLLLSAAAFWVLAYRFDNRFVLSLALSTFAGWCGVRISRLSFISGADLRISALFYGAAVILVGTWLYRWNLKKHFTETYFHIAALVMFTALISGVFEHKDAIYLLGLISLSVVATVGGIRFRRFAFVAYAILFSYAGVTAEVLRRFRLDTQGSLAYLIVSGSIVVCLIVFWARRSGRNS